MSNYIDSIYTAINDLISISADYISSYDLLVTNNTQLYNAVITNLTVTNVLNFPLNYMWSNLINQSPALAGTNHLVSTHFSDNITQSTGSNQLLDTSIGSITQSESAVIIQSGNQWNQLKQTQVTDLSITGTLTLPSNVVIAGSSYTHDLIMNNATIQQTAPPSMINTFAATDFYNGDVRLNKNLTMIGGADTQATLKNLVVEGNSALDTITGYTISDIYSKLASEEEAIIEINTDLLLKADKTYVDNQLVLKADKTYVDNQLVLKADKTYTDTQLALKSNIASPVFTGTVTTANLTANGNNIIAGNLYLPSTANTTNGNLFFYNTSRSISQPSSRIVLSAADAMFWDNVFATSLTFRWGTGNTVRQQLFANGDMSITGSILNCPTITTINSNIGLKADKTYTDAQLLLKDNVTSVDSKLLLKDDVTSVNSKLLLKADKTYVDTQLLLKDDVTSVDSKLLLKDDVTSVDSKLLLKDDVTSVDSKCLILQDQIDDIIASEYYESIAVGTTTTLEEDQQATVTNTGSNTNAVLNFGIPRGYRGYKGDQGDKGDRGPKGDDGKDGSDGSNGAAGDSSAATSAAIAAGVSAGIAAGAATGAAGAASSAAGSAASSAASAALAQVGIQELNVKVTGLQTQVDTLGEGMTQLDNDVIQLKTKTQYVTAGAGITSIASTLNTQIVNADSLYVANSVVVIDDVKASGFSGGLGETNIGGLTNTNIKGPNIKIGTNEVLFNFIEIGGPSTVTTINGIVNYANPMNTFFNQW